MDCFCILRGDDGKLMIFIFILASVGLTGLYDSDVSMGSEHPLSESFTASLLSIGSIFSWKHYWKYEIVNSQETTILIYIIKQYSCLLNHVFITIV